MFTTDYILNEPSFNLYIVQILFLFLYIIIVVERCIQIDSRRTEETYRKVT